MARAKSSAPSKVEIPMTPMIDIVFQLLIFFMLQLKIMAPEGSFDINMPAGAAGGASSLEENVPLKIVMRSDTEGNLTQISFGQTNLGSGDAAFDRLGQEIARAAGSGGKNLEAEIDADEELKYAYVIRAISKCTGKLDQNKQLVRYIEKIKFSPSRAK